MRAFIYFYGQRHELQNLSSWSYHLEAERPGFRKVGLFILTCDAGSQHPEWQLPKLSNFRQWHLCCRHLWMEESSFIHFCLWLRVASLTGQHWSFSVVIVSYVPQLWRTSSVLLLGFKHLASLLEHRSWNGIHGRQHSSLGWRVYWWLPMCVQHGLLALFVSSTAI